MSYFYISLYFNESKILRFNYFEVISNYELFLFQPIDTKFKKWKGIVKLKKKIEDGKEILRDFILSKVDEKNVIQKDFIEFQDLNEYLFELNKNAIVYEKKRKNKIAKVNLSILDRKNNKLVYTLNGFYPFYCDFDKKNLVPSFKTRVIKERITIDLYDEKLLKIDESFKKRWLLQVNPEEKYFKKKLKDFTIAHHSSIGFYKKTKENVLFKPIYSYKTIEQILLNLVNNVKNNNYEVYMKLSFYYMMVHPYRYMCFLISIIIKLGIMHPQIFHLVQMILAKEGQCLKITKYFATELLYICSDCYFNQYKVNIFPIKINLKLNKEFQLCLNLEEHLKYHLKKDEIKNFFNFWNVVINLNPRFSKIMYEMYGWSSITKERYISIIREVNVNSLVNYEFNITYDEIPNDVFFDEGVIRRIGEFSSFNTIFGNDVNNYCDLFKVNKNKKERFIEEFSKYIQPTKIDIQLDENFIQNFKDNMEEKELIENKIDVVLLKEEILIEEMKREFFNEIKKREKRFFDKILLNRKNFLKNKLK